MVEHELECTCTARFSYQPGFTPIISTSSTRGVVIEYAQKKCEADPMQV
jgi:hypothetical protein